MPDINPYYQWFGIDSTEIPDARTLLGISSTATAEEIEQAFKQRQSVLQAFLDGPHHDMASRLLLEIEDARQKASLELSIQQQKKDQPITRDESNLPLATSINEHKVTSSSGSRRQKKRQDNNFGLQIAMFFVPTALLLFILIFFPGVMTGMVNGIRTLVYGPKPEKENENQEIPPSGTESKNKNSQAQRQDATRNSLKSRPLDSKVDLNSPHSGGTSQSSPNISKKRAPQPTSNNSENNAPAPKREGSGKKSRPHREAVEHYLREFAKLPIAEPAEFFGLADAESQPAKQFAIFQFGMDLAMVKSSVDELILGFEMWNRHFDMDWEKEVLHRILKAEFTTTGVRVSFVNQLPQLVSRCRSELCIEGGIELCQSAISMFPQSSPTVNYLKPQLAIFSQARLFDQAADTPEKKIFESLFLDQSTVEPKTPAIAKSYFDLLSRADQLIGARNSADISRYDETLKQLKDESEKLSAQIQTEATRHLIQESLNGITSRIKTEVQRIGVDWSDRSNSKYAFRTEELYSIPISSGSKTPFFLEQAAPLALEKSVRRIGFSGKSSRLFVITPDSMTVVDPASRRMIRHNAKIKDTRDLLEHPTSYLTVNFEGRTIRWRDISTNKILTAKLELASTSLRGSVEGERPERFRQIGVLNARGDVIVQNGPHLIQVFFPRQGGTPKLQERFDAGISDPIGIVTQAKNVVAVIGQEEIAILENRKETRRIQHNSVARDFIFSQEKEIYYLVTQTRLVKLGGPIPTQIELPKIVQVEEIDNDLLLVMRKFGESIYALQLIKIADAKAKVLQETLCSSPQFTLSHDRKFIAVADGAQVRLMSIKLP